MPINVYPAPQSLVVPEPIYLYFRPVYTHHALAAIERVVDAVSFLFAESALWAASLAHPMQLLANLPPVQCLYGIA